MKTHRISWIVLFALMALPLIVFYSCSDDDTSNDKPDRVTDIDGNVYNTVILGTQEWFVQNLRVTKYNNGDPIPTGLSNAEWSSTTRGAYAIYPHGSIDGINSPEEMVAAYGKLYNWHAVNSRYLCPIGWSVPSHEDWTRLVHYVIDQGFPNSNVADGLGNALRSCRQVNSPQGGQCNTSTHPRWNSHDTHSGFDEFGFSALPAGRRSSNGHYHGIGTAGLWWSSSEWTSSFAYFRSIISSNGMMNWWTEEKQGFSVRCFRHVTN